MSEERKKLDVCPECSVRDKDSSEKTVYRCQYCERYFCFKHFDPKLAVFRDFKGRIKDKRLRHMIEEDWKRKDGHPDWSYTLARLKEYDIEKRIDRKIIEDMLNRSKAYGRKKPRKQVREGDFYFIKEDKAKGREPKPKIKKSRKRALRLSRKVKAAVILAVSLIVIGIFVLSWANFFAQIILPHFTDTAQVEVAIFDLINEERANRGLPILLKDEALKTIALLWSENLTEIDTLTHGDFEGRIAQIGYSEYKCGEIIAMYGGWAPDLGRKFVDMWLDSIGHREIMLTSLSGYMGIGVSKIGSSFYAVVDFRFS